MKKIFILSIGLIFFTMCKKDEDKTPSSSNNSANQTPVVAVDSLIYDGVSYVFSQYTTLTESDFGETYHDMVFMQNRGDYKLEKNIDDEIVFVSGVLIDLTFIVNGENQLLLDSIYSVDESVELSLLNSSGEFEALSGTVEYSLNLQKVIFDVTLENNKTLKGVLALPSKRLSQMEYQEFIEQILLDNGLTLDDIEQDDEVSID